MLYMRGDGAGRLCRDGAGRLCRDGCRRDTLLYTVPPCLDAGQPPVLLPPSVPGCTTLLLLLSLLYGAAVSGMPRAAGEGPGLKKENNTGQERVLCAESLFLLWESGC